MLTYVHYYDEEGKFLDHGRILDVEPTVGYVVERYCTEGFIPWEIIDIVPNGTVFNNKPLIKATVKIHPFVKTHCDHHWINTTHAQIIPKFLRTCAKCGLYQEYTYGKSTWVTVNDISN